MRGRRKCGWGDLEMTADKPQIDPVLFQLQFAAFKKFVEEKTGVIFTSFASHPHVEKEGYKYEIHRAAREALAFQTWKKSDIGSGKIIAATIKSIEFQKNNLVPWQAKYGDEARPHHPLYTAQNEQSQKQKIETCLFQLYHEQRDEESFSELVNIFGKEYPLIAYLFFLKDRSQYLPIKPKFLDKSFSYLGAEFKTSQRCSWENYQIFVGLIGELKAMLAETLLTEVTLLDAHSFAWILATDMESESKLADVQGYLNLSVTERDAIVKARIGQGKFRQSLIEYWSKCAVTGCSETQLLRASHIKPWSKASPTDRLSLYNGLLLSPSLDACFDSGFISFDDNGKILISPRLSKENAEALSINPEMQLQKIAPEHKVYLSYHRENIYKQNAFVQQDWQFLFALIPEIENVSKFGEWKGGEKTPDGSITMPWCEPAPIVKRFLDMVYSIPIIISFDWGSWEEGEKIASNVNSDFDRLDIFTKCKLITAIVRNDRFCEGALVSAFESGLILRILKSIEKEVIDKNHK